MVKVPSCSSPTPGGEIGRRRGQLLGSGGERDHRAQDLPHLCQDLRAVQAGGGVEERGKVHKEVGLLRRLGGGGGALLPPDRRGGAGERQEAQQSGGRPEPAAGRKFFMGHLPAGIFEGPGT